MTTKVNLVSDRVPPPIGFAFSKGQKTLEASKAFLPYRMKGMLGFGR